MGEARQCPPDAQASSRKGGGKVVGRWEKPGSVHPMPRLHIGKVGKGWSVKAWGKQMPGINKQTYKQKNALPLHGKALFSTSSLFLQGKHKLFIWCYIIGCLVVIGDKSWFGAGWFFDMPD